MLVAVAEQRKFGFSDKISVGYRWYETYVWTAYVLINTGNVGLGMTKLWSLMM